MKKTYFEDIFELAERILFIYGETYNDISIYINTDDSIDLIRELIGQDYADMDNLYIESINVDLYKSSDVILITIDKNGGIWAEDAGCDDGFKRVDSCYIFTEPKFYNNVVKANDSDINYIVFAFGEEEEVPEKKKVTILTDDVKKISGFRYEDKKDGGCFSVEFCNYAPVEDIDGMLTMCEKILDAYAKFLG